MPLPTIPRPDLEYQQGRLDAEGLRSIIRGWYPNISRWLSYLSFAFFFLFSPVGIKLRWGSIHFGQVFVLFLFSAGVGVLIGRGLAWFLVQQVLLPEAERVITERERKQGE